MRPSPRLLALALALATLTVFVVLYVPRSDSLIVPLWALLAVLAILDLGVSMPARRIRLSLSVPKSGYVGQYAEARAQARPAGGAFPPGLQLRLTAPRMLGGPQTLLADADGEVRFSLPMSRRGEHAITALSALWQSRLGLFEIIADAPQDARLSVLPDVSPVLAGQITAQMIPLMDGMKDMNLRGEGSEFHQLREFTAGMDPRSIDWKRSGRMRMLVARETRAERNHQIILGIDSGRLMGERIAGLPKLDRAINASLALAWAGGLGGDQVGLYTFDSRPRLYIPPSPGRLAFTRIRAASVDLAYEAAETNHTLGLTHLLSRLKRRSLVIVFSDFADSITSELLVENTALLARHHLVLYIALRDPALGAIAAPKEISMEAIARSVAASQMLDERQTVLERLARLGVLCLDTTPDKLTAALVSRYIDIKSRELI